MTQDELSNSNDPQVNDQGANAASGQAAGLEGMPGLGAGPSNTPMLDDLSASDTMSVGTSGALGGLSGVGSMGGSVVDDAHTLGGRPNTDGSQPMGDSSLSRGNSSSAGGGSSGS